MILNHFQQEPAIEAVSKPKRPHFYLRKRTKMHGQIVLNKIHSSLGFAPIHI
jgi:hypothetical protein